MVWRNESTLVACLREGTPAPPAAVVEPRVGWIGGVVGKRQGSETAAPENGTDSDGSS